MKLSNSISKEFPVIAWWSGGVTSAVACKLCLDWFGSDCVSLIFQDTKNESDDTYRFKLDCEKWYGKEIISISAIPHKYSNIKEIWYKFLSLNTATGAICSTELKRAVRQEYQKNNQYSHQAWGYDINEPSRALAMTLNYPETNAIHPLLLLAYTKKKCASIITAAGIELPEAYLKGYENNNCDKTGCIQGGIGYWQMKRDKEPEVFNEMATIEHDLTNMKGKPVTILKDQSGKKKGFVPVFLKPHPDYPHIKDISMMKGRPPKPLMECNGFCGVDDLKKNKTENELNYDS